MSAATAPNQIPESDLSRTSGFSQAGVGATLNLGKNILSGLDRGVAGLAGLPADALGFMIDIVDQSVAKATGRPYEDVAAENDALRPISRETLSQWGSHAAHANSPLKHEPESRADKYIQSAVEFVPSALSPAATGKALVRQLITLGVLPGIISESAGHATEGTKWEPYARGAGALAGGAAGLWAANSAGSAVSHATRGATPAQLGAAERLFEYAQSVGAPITRAEAVQHVTGGATSLTDLQRILEGAGEMRPFFAQRPGQVDAAARQQFDSVLGPNAAIPSSIGPQLSGAANAIVRDTHDSIARAAQPYFQAAQAQRVGAEVQRALMADRLYARTLADIRNSPQLSRTIAHLPDDAVGTIDLVQRRMREQAENARAPGQSASNLAAKNLEDARTAPIAAADTATGSLPGVAGSYEMARTVEHELRRQHLDTLMAGPTGKLAAKDMTTGRAIEVLFSAKPLPNSQAEIVEAVSALAKRRPAAARQVVRAHVEWTFGEAVKNAQIGAREFAGPGFVAALRGNPQQAGNLEAVITALHGQQTWQGFDRFLSVLEAQGTRHHPGAPGLFNREVETVLQGGTIEKALAASATGGVKLPQLARDAVQRWRLGQNVGQIADALTNPASAQLFRQLATAQPNSAKAAAIVTRLAFMATQGARTRDSMATPRQ